MENKIRLIDVLQGLRAENFPKNRRRKLRFNKSWVDELPDGTRVPQDFKELYRNKDPNFEPWLLSLGSESKKRLSEKDNVFQFIEIEPHRWLFVGAYEVIDLDNNATNPATKKPFKYANAKRLTEFDNFADRLVVAFTNKGQSFYYVDPETIDNVEVFTILDKPYRLHTDEFPGYEKVCMSYADLKRCINNPEWKTALSSVFGVYVLADTKTGKLYVGSATGDDGIYGRWSTYLDSKYEDIDKTYPNKELAALVKKEGLDYIKTNFQYSILQTFSKTDLGKTDALTRESYWKKVLQSLSFGYNAN